MPSFLTDHEQQIKGTLSGFDRLRFRGTLRWIANLNVMNLNVMNLNVMNLNVMNLNVMNLWGMEIWLSRSSIWYKHFKEYAPGLTDQIKQSTQEIAEEAEPTLAEATLAEATLAEATQALGQGTEWKGRTARALNPFNAEDAKLIETVNRGEFTLLDH